MATSFAEPFARWCGVGHSGMDCRSFIALCRDSGLLQDGFSENDAEAIFGKAMLVAKRRLDLSRFELALRLVAEKRGLQDSEIHSVLLQHAGVDATAPDKDARIPDPVSPKSLASLEGVGDDASNRAHRSKSRSKKEKRAKKDQAFEEHRVKEPHRSSADLLAALAVKPLPSNTPRPSFTNEPIHDTALLEEEVLSPTGRSSLLPSSCAPPASHARSGNRSVSSVLRAATVTSGVMDSSSAHYSEERVPASKADGRERHTSTGRELMEDSPEQGMPSPPRIVKRAASTGDVSSTSGSRSHSKGRSERHTHEATDQSRQHSGSSEEAQLARAFKKFCGKSSGLDARSFVRVCKHAGLLENRFSAQDARLAFSEAVLLGHTSMDWGSFRAALDKVAYKKGIDAEELNHLVIHVAESYVPPSHSEESSSSSSHTDAVRGGDGRRQALDRSASSSMLASSSGGSVPSAPKEDKPSKPRRQQSKGSLQDDVMRQMVSQSEPLGGFSRGGLKKKHHGAGERRRVSVSFGSAGETDHLAEVIQEYSSNPPSPKSPAGPRLRLSCTAQDWHGHAREQETDEARAFRFAGRRNSDTSLCMSPSTSLTEAPDAERRSSSKVKPSLTPKLGRRHSESSLTKEGSPAGADEGLLKALHVETLQSLSRTSTPSTPNHGRAHGHSQGTGFRRPSTPQVVGSVLPPSMASPTAELGRPAGARPPGPLARQVSLSKIDHESLSPVARPPGSSSLIRPPTVIPPPPGGHHLDPGHVDQESPENLQDSELSGVYSSMPLMPLLDKASAGTSMAVAINDRKVGLEAHEDSSGSDDTSTLCPETSVAGSSNDF